MPEAGTPRAPIAYLDPGWLFLLAGLLIIAATVLLPAFEDLNEVRWQRDRAIVAYKHREARNARYLGYLEALQREEPSLVLALAATQLNQIPEGRTLILEPPDPATASASVFTDLEPPDPVMPERVRAGSMLERLTSEERTRPWLIAAGALCLLLGLLPRSRAYEPA